MASMMRDAVVSISVLAIGALMACDPKVADPADESGDEDAELDESESDDDDESGGTPGTTATTGQGGSNDGGEPGTSAGSGPEPGCDEGGDCPEPPPAVQHAFAIRFGDLPPVDVGGSDSGGSGGGEEIDPDTLLVVITDGPADCDDPWAALACGQWRVSFSLPPGTLPGTHALFPDLNGGSSATGPADQSGECWFGGGSLEGTLELTATDTAIVGRIVDAQSFDFDANVEFTAALCE